MAKNRNQEAQAKAPAAPSRLADYFWANVIFFTFLSALAFVVWQSCSDPTDDAAVQQVLKEAFSFMICLFGGGFIVVSLFDAAYDFFAEKAETTDPQP
jgi:hypothetical protein